MSYLVRTTTKIFHSKKPKRVLNIRIRILDCFKVVHDYDRKICTKMSFCEKMAFIYDFVTSMLEVKENDYFKHLFSWLIFLFCTYRHLQMDHHSFFYIQNCGWNWTLYILIVLFIIITAAFYFFFHIFFRHLSFDTFY